ncbi:bifunctional GNAT family N-acetyltransferase/acetate--CoA ligase family protein [Nocardioides sp. CFH 31398]|uniref:bifunctional acetate--CoA ligase family protein/GNAT family N-acetyltransferase n=1 Tax=Nocardioides sp. CFH 31398 TaxID=2919579 RepID=UPI001F0605A4|nr:bifunctional GNAT family N-acetyltransferase/acetate--CoA ligase family protein [Nocardioides sp. CFH 31398]MCH1868360.1 bifunctional GNAT family N-acetyltransferase/acetate--CoA ligase family protein [Nocardioides sp. CFH 31398]
MTDEATEQHTAPTAPRHWEADVLLRDGRTAHLRPIRPEDADLLVEFYARVSDESKYYRFFTPMPQLSARDVVRFTQVDHHDRVAFVLTVAERMIAVGRYDVVGDGEAEVAFLVEDRHQGRGIAQLLLEHLAQAGRERGLSRFSAEVLPDNQRMVQVFRDAGYHMASGYEDGVIRLEFGIDPTETAIGVMEQREHRAESASIQAFFHARSVAVIGASRRSDTIGQTLVRNLVTGDFTGRVYAVNPGAKAVSGMPAYESVTDIDDPVDVAIVAVPADKVEEVVLDCAGKGVHGLVVISSGFAETGDEGRQRQRRLVGLARSYGLRLIGPNCLGIINTSPDHSLNASLSTVMPPRGRAGFFCQSGALGTAILEKVQNRGLGLSTFVSAGNRADVSGNDLLQYWQDDDSTEVVLLYLESIGNPRKFSRIARRVSRRKPVIAVRSGRSSQGVPMGHAVRTIAAPGQAVDAMFRQAGIIQVDTLEEMFDVAQLLAHQPLPAGGRVAVVGNSDALGLLATDAAAAVNLSVTRSLSLGADATAEDFEDALDEAIDDPEVDSVVALYVPPLNVSGEDVANVLAAVGEQSDKPLVSSFLGAEGVPELLRVPDVAGSTAGRGSVPSYPAVESAVRSLACVVGYVEWLRGAEDDHAEHDAQTVAADDQPADGEDEIDASTAKRLVNQVLIDSPEGRELTRDELRTLLGAYGVELSRSARVDDLSQALDAGERMGWDVVLKATAERLRQRPDQAHVRRGINSPEEMREAWHSLTALLTDPEDAGFVVQETAPPGVPVAISSTEDPLFGPVISFGISGPLTELLGDKAYRIPPLSRRDAAAMVREVKGAPILFGYRGSEPADVDEIERLLRRVAGLQNDLPQLQAVDLPLVLVGTEGARVLNASAHVAPVVDPRSDWFVRRLSTMPGDTLQD